MSRLVGPMVLLWLVCACTSEPPAKQPDVGASKSSKPSKSVEPDEPVEQDEPVEPPAPAKDPEPVVEERITITAEEAAAAGLPALGFSLATTGSGMSGSKLGDGRYLVLSGPPGGPLMLLVSPATVGGELSKLVGEDRRLDATLVEEQVELLGEPRRAAAWITGAGMARTSWCAVILGRPGTKQGDPALLLEVGTGYRGDATECASTLEDPNLEPVIRSLKLDP